LLYGNLMRGRGGTQEEMGIYPKVEPIVTTSLSCKQIGRFHPRKAHFPLQ